MKIKKIETFGKADVYNMEVENHHNFSVNGGFIVHNCDAIRYYCSGRPRPARMPKPKPIYNFDFEKPKVNPLGKGNKRNVI